MYNIIFLLPPFFYFIQKTNVKFPHSQSAPYFYILFSINKFLVILLCQKRIEIQEQFEYDYMSILYNMMRTKYILNIFLL